MSRLVPFERARLLVGDVPILLVPALDQTAALPPLRRTAEREVATCEGWRLAARMAMTIVDGPADDGFAVAGRLDSDALMRWCEAVDEHGTAVVLAFDGWDETTDPGALIDLAAERGARGGAMPAIPPGG